MICPNDLHELGYHTIEHYYSQIIEKQLQCQYTSSEEMIKELSKKQKLDLLDFMDRKTAMNPTGTVIECNELIEEIVSKWI